MSQGLQFRTWDSTLFSYTIPVKEAVEEVMCSVTHTHAHTQPYYTHRLQGKIPFLFFYFKSQRSYVPGIYLSTFSFYLFISLLCYGMTCFSLVEFLSFRSFFILQGSRIFDEMSSHTKETTTLLQGEKNKKTFRGDNLQEYNEHLYFYHSP